MYYFISLFPVSLAYPDSRWQRSSKPWTSHLGQAYSLPIITMTLLRDVSLDKATHYIYLQFHLSYCRVSDGKAPRVIFSIGEPDEW